MSHRSIEACLAPSFLRRIDQTLGVPLIVNPGSDQVEVTLHPDRGGYPVSEGDFRTHPARYRCGLCCNLPPDRGATRSASHLGCASSRCPTAPIGYPVPTISELINTNFGLIRTLLTITWLRRVAGGRRRTSSKTIRLHLDPHIAGT